MLNRGDESRSVGFAWMLGSAATFFLIIQWLGSPHPPKLLIMVASFIGILMAYLGGRRGGIDVGIRISLGEFSEEKT